MVSKAPLLHWQRGSTHAHCQKHSTTTSSTVGIGDIVLVHDQDQSSQGAETPNWKRRSDAVLKVANKSGRPATLQRPVRRIYPLGVTQSETFDEPEAPDNAENPELEENHETERLKHPQRNSALRAWTSEIMEEDEPD